jgi:hypothetical protein
MLNFRERKRDKKIEAAYSNQQTKCLQMIDLVRKQMKQNSSQDMHARTSVRLLYLMRAGTNM